MKKKLIVILVLMFLPLLMGATYNYSYHGNVVYSTPGFVFANYYDYQSMEIGNETRDVSPEYFVVYEDNIYLVDSALNELLIIDKTFKLVSRHKTFLNPTTNESFTLNSPQGLDVKPTGIYIADTNNERIIKLNHNFEVIDIFTEPESAVFESSNFRPIRITVDDHERMYVIARNVFDGVLELSENGEFNRFVGVNPIQLSAIEIFRRSLMTEQQKSQLPSFLPTTYTSVNINEDSFIYTTSKPNDESNQSMIQLISPKGIDVLNRAGYFAPMGDVHFLSLRTKYRVSEGTSDLVDIAYTNGGIYSVLDQRRSRVFTYDSDGNLLYIINGAGNQMDKIKRGSSLRYLGDDLVILDAENKMFSVYRQTEFGENINEAVKLQDLGKFDEAEEVWRKVIEQNSNYEVAYNGVGKSLLRKGEYREAMRYFKLGYDKYYYSKAFKEYRNKILRDNFTYIFLGVVLVSGLLIGRSIYKKYKKGEGLLYED